MYFTSPPNVRSNLNPLNLTLITFQTDLVKKLKERYKFKKNRRVIQNIRKYLNAVKLIEIAEFIKFINIYFLSTKH